MKMVWQDIIFFIGQWVFLVALVPALTSREKPPVSTSLITGLILVVFSFTYFTLELWLSAISSALIAAAWLTLALQKFGTDKKIKRKK